MDEAALETLGQTTNFAEHDSGSVDPMSPIVGVQNGFSEELLGDIYFEHNGDIYKAPVGGPLDLDTGLPVNSRFWSTNTSSAAKTLDDIRKQDAQARGASSKKEKTFNDPEQVKRKNNAEAARAENRVTDEVKRVASGEDVGKENTPDSIAKKPSIQEMTDAAQDWKYLVYARGGMARKSDLDDFLMKKFGIDPYDARNISNGLDNHDLPWVLDMFI